MEIWRLVFQSAWIILAVAWAYPHFRKITIKKIEPGSVGDYFLRIWFGCLFAGASIITINFGDPTYEWQTFAKLGSDLVSKAGVFWLVFDLALNLMRGKKWNYISLTNGKFFDKIFKGNWKLQLVAKGATIGIGELIYYLT
jgi:hypothetical protein